MLDVSPPALGGLSIDGILVEEYIAGRDIVVPFLEAAAPETRGILEPAEYVYMKGGERRVAILELEMKMRGFEARYADRARAFEQRVVRADVEIDLALPWPVVRPAS